LDLFYPYLLLPIFLRLRWWGYSLDMKTTHLAIREALTYLGMDKPVAFVCTPMASQAAQAINTSKIVFSADDNWLHHPGIRGETLLLDLKKRYEELIRVSDVIFANSRELVLNLFSSRSDVIVLRNGVNVEEFAPRGRPEPEDLHHIPKPRIGYAGTLSRRINVELLVECANALPEASFVILGPNLDRAWLRPLNSIHTIYMLGDRHYNLLPAYLEHFDVCIIPHNVGQYENHGDPIKLYEYLAAGKPVVTTSIAGVDTFADVIVVAKTVDEFIEGIRMYVEMADYDRYQLGRRLSQRIPVEFSWRYIANEMISLIIASNNH